LVTTYKDLAIEENTTQLTYTMLRSIRVIEVINVKYFHGSLTTVVRAQNDTTKTANITV